MTGNAAPNAWRVQFKDDTLTLEGISDNNKGEVMQYRKVDHLPE
jgi:hypothetical protein